MRITVLRESPRRPGRYLLTLENGEQLLVSVTVLAEVGATRVGVELSPASVERLTHESRVTALADRALDALARGRRTRRELEVRLRRGEADAAEVREALDRLEAGGVLSDADVAQAEALSRLRRGEAPARVRAVLRRKGVAAPLVGEAVREAVAGDGFDERAACEAAADKRWRTLSGLEVDVARRRLQGFLLRRGFSSAVVQAVTRRLLRGDG